MNKEDIHINFLQEVLELQGYSKLDVEHLTTDDIEIKGEYIKLEIDKTEFEISLHEYIEYRDWWIAIERERKINSILNDDN